MTDQSRLLGILKVVRDAGPLLEPKWDPAAREGFVYAGSGSALTDAALLPGLEELADRDYLERVFVNRISLCPNCGSHALNMHEICLECHSANILAVETLLHFRCGFVGPASAFSEEASGYRCPKCHRLLQELGTDHTRPGDYFACRKCNATFQLPAVGAMCLACGGSFPGDQLRKIRYRSVYAYRLSGLGRAALESERLLEEIHEARYEPDGRHYRRHVILELVEDECRRDRKLGTPFGLILISENGESAVERVRPVLAETDKLGRLDDHHLVALLPGASKRRTAATIRRLSPLRAVPVEIQDPVLVADHLDDAARRNDRAL